MVSPSYGRSSARRCQARISSRVVRPSARSGRPDVSAARRGGGVYESVADLRALQHRIDSRVERLGFGLQDRLRRRHRPLHRQPVENGQ